MKKIKNVLNYIIIYICMVALLFSALVVSSKIPHSAIEKQLNKSAEFYGTIAGVYRIKVLKLYSYIHYYADTRKLSIINYIDSENPVESTLWAKYYKDKKSDSNRDFVNAIEQQKEANSNYLRYWNGCMLFLRPMLTIFDMEQIYLINKILLSILILVLFVMLIKKSKKLAFIFLLALILVSIWYATFCIEYSVMIYVMTITSMIAIKIDNNKKNKELKEVDENLFKLFLITGIVTTFIDFLTTEILTFFVPLLMILIIRKEQNRLDRLKNIYKFVLKAFALWFVGYAGMWLTKWILSSLILHINAFDYVKENFALRIYGLQGLENYEKLYGHVIERNLFSIPLMDLIKVNFDKWQVKLTISIVLGLILIFFNWKELKNKKYLILFAIIGIMPYIRYLILANHSYRHAMFTFRDQIITIMCILYIIIECFNYKLLFKKLILRKSR